MTTSGYEYRSEFAREFIAKGKAEGEAKGKAEAVLSLLEIRAVPVSDDAREMILGCTDHAELGVWLERAITARTADDVLG